MEQDSHLKKKGAKNSHLNVPQTVLFPPKKHIFSAHTVVYDLWADKAHPALRLSNSEKNGHHINDYNSNENSFYYFDYPPAAEEEAGYFSLYFLSWLSPLIYKASEEAITLEDFSGPRRDHRARNSGMFANVLFRDKLLLKKRDLWEPFVYRVADNEYSNPEFDLSRNSNRNKDPYYFSRVVYVPNGVKGIKSIIKGGKGNTNGQIEGILRWVGTLTTGQNDEKQSLLAGVEWLGALPPYRQKLLNEFRQDKDLHVEYKTGTFLAKLIRYVYPDYGKKDPPATIDDIVHRGTVHNEPLFTQLWRSGPPLCTLEPVENLYLCHKMDQLNEDINYNDAIRKNNERQILDRPKLPSLAGVLFTVFKKDFSNIAILALLNCSFMAAVPYLIELYVDFLSKSITVDGKKIESGARLMSAEGILALLSFLLICAIRPLVDNKLEQRCVRTATAFQSATLSLVFEKSILISQRSLSLPSMNPGRILTIASSDVGNIKEFPMHVCYLFTSPASLFFYVFLLYRLMGYNFIAAFVVLLATIPIQVFLAKKEEEAREAMSKYTDKRMKKTNEFLSGIRVIKTMSWEKQFLMAIEKYRAKELYFRYRLQFYHALSSGLCDGTPLLMIFSVIASYIIISNPSEGLTPRIVFPSLSIMNALGWPFYILPIAIQALIKFIVSVRRISPFLAANDEHLTTKDIESYFGKSFDDGSPLRKPTTMPANSNNHNTNNDGIATTENLAALFDDVSIQLYQPSELPPARCRASNSGLLSMIIRFFRRSSSGPIEACLIEEDEDVDQVGFTMHKKDDEESEMVNFSPREIADGAAHCESTSQAEQGVVLKVDVGSNEKDEDAHEKGENQRTVLFPKTILSNINLRIEKGKLTMIIGPTGSGKSTLLRALLGMAKIVPSDSAEINGSTGNLWIQRNVAFVPEQPWIMNATLRENILFFEGERHQRIDGKDNERLRNALKDCQLEEDLNSLADGLETEIGEKGINLSGGQKARVGLARAVYANKEVYLMDDPLAALDAHVGKKMFEELILTRLLDKTRVLVTHQAHLLHHAHHVVFVDNGTIAFQGSHLEFLNSPYANFVAGTYGSGKQVHESFGGENEETDIEKQNSINEADLLPRNAEEENDAVSASSGLLSRQRTGPYFEDGEGIKKHDGDKPSIPDKVSRITVDEEKAVGHIPLSLYKHYLTYKTGLGWVILCGLVYLAAELSFLFIALILTAWSTKMFPSWNDTVYLVVYASLIASQLILAPIRCIASFHVTIESSRSLHQELLLSIASGSLRFFDSTPLGRILNRFARDVYVLDDELPTNTLFLIILIIACLASLIISIISLPIMILPILGSGYIFYRFSTFYKIVIREVRRTNSIVRSPIFSLLEEILSGREVIRSFGKDSCIFSEAMRRIDTLYSVSYTEDAINMWLSIRAQYVGSFVVAIICILGFFGKVFFGFTNTQLSLVSLSLTMCFELSWILPILVRQLAALEASMSSVQRIMEYTEAIDREALDFRPALEELNPSGDAKSDVESVASNSQAITLEGGEVAREFSPSLVANTESLSQEANLPSISITFENVHLRYRPDLPWVLKRLNFQIAPREKIGVVGRTGSGKSTLLLALLRLIEIHHDPTINASNTDSSHSTQSGRILIAGRDIRTMPLQLLRQHFAMIPQDPLLFEGTIRTNLDPFHEHTDEALYEALSLVGLHSKSISAISSSSFFFFSLNYAVELGGQNLSVGQRQLLCLARAWLQHRQSCGILLMDEATAHVDPNLDAAIQRTVHSAFYNHTVLTIAHRLHTVAHYDRVLVLRAGEVVEFAPPAVLLAQKSSLFRQMVLQAAAAAHIQEDQAIQEFLNKGKSFSRP